ncbi:Uroporphyrinogen decarboxylase [Desulfurobacterium thermolithotrophum DSM 11699]|uniref:Uroporphyrinogen decarboxylase n=1 Tax=Desulfurobacterium thermolithotrophum (strain DSM 11699 / BSA) TaxID=868864 RepID=F0S1S5_DESTD|nr:uroporphyrinogen decarboxylase [Desulfurobacterium thermolithotrophum]ADY72930.1 Uroporphyrinogen decarboxylase [Desulfurobacterium thermolithotrophum DSM 11699]
MKDHPILKAARGEKTDYTPIWIMRQAGRYSERYRKIRAQAGSFMELCKNPKLAAEVTLIPIEEIGIDAAILFSDILVPLEKMGIDVSFVEGKGPILEPKAEKLEDVEKLKIPEPEKDLPYVLETIQLIKKRLTDRPLIGFSGAPFTLASYMLEGGSSKNYIAAKSTMWNEPELWDALMSKLAETVIEYLSSQIKAGVDLIQIFDSWMGVLSKDDYEKFVFPYTERIVNELKKRYPEIPIIHFGVNAGHLLEVNNRLSVDVIGLDWKTEIPFALERIDKSIQGNLDPVTLFADEKIIEERVRKILIEGLKARGHIFNLGHGILPPTDPKKAKFLVDTVHKVSKELRG